MLGLQVLLRFLSKILRLTWTGGCLKFVHYIHMEYFGFIDVLPTVKTPLSAFFCRNEKERKNMRQRIFWNWHVSKGVGYLLLFASFCKVREKGTDFCCFKLSTVEKKFWHFLQFWLRFCSNQKLKDDKCLHLVHWNKRAAHNSFLALFYLMKRKWRHLEHTEYRNISTVSSFFF